MTTQITQATVDALTTVSGADIASVSVNVLKRQSGAHIASASAEAMHRQLLPSVRIASIYFNTENVSMREVFEKTGATSLMALVNRENGVAQ
jgi:hypothetical protein